MADASVDRDSLLRMDDDALKAQCQVKRYRASGPGGQRRNKVETAVRLKHGPTSIVVKAEESRHMHENLARALGRLRLGIALAVRRPLGQELPPEFLAQRGRGGTLSVRTSNPAYPIVVAVALDALDGADGSYAAAARDLGLTTSQLVRFLRSDPRLRGAAASVRGRP